MASHSRYDEPGSEANGIGYLCLAAFALTLALFWYPKLEGYLPHCDPKTLNVMQWGLYGSAIVVYLGYWIACKARWLVIELAVIPIGVLLLAKAWMLAWDAEPFSRGWP